MMIGRNIYYLLNSSQRQLLRRLVFYPSDLMLKITGKKNELVPDKGLNYTGRGDFILQGKKFLGYLIEYGGLESHHHILEVGCGLGRMAFPLLDFVNKKGYYKGFDIVKEGVDWCKKNISSVNPSFQFTHCDLQNDLYNSRGRIKSTDFIFPFADEEFDFVIITSVFTHMLKAEVLHYLDELNRVMKNGARAFITWFLINPESIMMMEKGYAEIVFPFIFENYRIMNKYTGTGNVAYDELFIHAELENRHFRIRKNLPGNWCGRKPGNSTDFQDIMIIQKT